MKAMPTTVRFSKEIRQSLNKRCKAEQRSINYILNRLVMRYLKTKKAA